MAEFLLHLLHVGLFFGNENPLSLADKFMVVDGRNYFTFTQRVNLAGILILMGRYLI
jgi:hypothetical protein